MRQRKDGRIDTRTERAKLEPQGTPYWVVLEKGRSLGYRKGKRSGEWVARHHDPTGQPRHLHHGLGSADDYADADGVDVLDYTQAQAAARKWFEVARKAAPRAVTVAVAVEEYIEDRKRHGAKTADRIRWDFDAHVIPHLGTVDVGQVTRRVVEDWLLKVAETAPRNGAESDPRARRNSANRLWKSLRAALRLACDVHEIEPGWGKPRTFTGVDVARVRFLSIDESSRLVDACEGKFKALVQAGLFTGAREGELGRLTARDLEGDRLWIAPGKTGKGRWVVLQDDAVSWFSAFCKGMGLDDVLFPGWGSSATVMRHMDAACTTANIERLTFHELRHTYASMLINRGVPPVFVAAQLV